MRDIPIVRSVCVVLLAATASSCSEDPSDPGTQARPLLSLQDTVVQADPARYGFDVHIPIELANDGDSHLRMPACSGSGSGPVLEKRVDGAWAEVWALPAGRCLGETVTVEPGGSARFDHRVYGALRSLVMPGQSGDPDAWRFTADDIDGTYRLVLPLERGDDSVGWTPADAADLITPQFRIRDTDPPIGALSVEQRPAALPCALVATEVPDPLDLEAVSREEPWAWTAARVPGGWAGFRRDDDNAIAAVRIVDPARTDEAMPALRFLQHIDGDPVIETAAWDALDLLGCHRALQRETEGMDGVHWIDHDYESLEAWVRDDAARAQVLESAAALGIPGEMLRFSYSTAEPWCRRDTADLEGMDLSYGDNRYLTWALRIPGGFAAFVADTLYLTDTTVADAARDSLAAVLTDAGFDDAEERAATAEVRQARWDWFDLHGCHPVYKSIGFSFYGAYASRIANAENRLSIRFVSETIAQEALRRARLALPDSMATYEAGPRPTAY